MSGQHRAIREKPEKDQKAGALERVRKWLKGSPMPEPSDTCPTCGQVIPELQSPASQVT